MISRDAQAYVKQREKRLAQSIDIVTEELSLKVGTDDVITAINASSEGISIDAQRININGVVSANGGFMIDEDGNMTANNGTFNGVINATDGSFTGEINATSGTIDSVTATNLEVDSGTFSGQLNAATGTINNVVASNLTINNGKINIKTESSTNDLISLTYTTGESSTRTYMTGRYIGVSEAGDSSTILSANNLTLVDDDVNNVITSSGNNVSIASGRVVANMGVVNPTSSRPYGAVRVYGYSNSGTSLAGYIEIDAKQSPWIYIANSETGESIAITASSNVAELSYTVVSTF